MTSRSDLERQLAEALEAVEWGEFTEVEGGREVRACPWCGAEKGETKEHSTDCKLSLALSAFRGDTTNKPT